MKYVILLSTTLLASPALAHGSNQWQGQGQIQGQTQGQSQSLYNSIKNTNNNYNSNANYNFNKNSAAANAHATGGNATGGNATSGSNGTNINYTNTGSNVPWYGYGSGVAIAPSGSSSSCTDTTSFAAGFIGSVAFGIPRDNHSCNIRANYITFYKDLPKSVRHNLMCEDRYMNTAFGNCTVKAIQ